MDGQPLVLDNGSYEIKFSCGEKMVSRALNAVAKDKYDAFYISNQMRGIRDISGVVIRRPYEWGQLVSWELETSIWDYCLYNPATFGGFDASAQRDLNLICSETCMSLPELSKHTDQVLFEEYEFNSVFKGPVAGFVPFCADDRDMELVHSKHSAITKERTKRETEYSDFQLVVDSGFNCTWIVPVIKGVPYYKAVKKLDVGGRLLTGILKEQLSFRHYNVMDETILVNNIKEKCSFMSPTSYFDSFKNKDKESLEYVLPDFQTSFLGYVREPGTQLAANAQTVILQDERFSVPETFFHPEIAQIIKPGLIETILESLSMLPELLRPLMVGNIVCLGGNFNIKHFGARLARELQRQLPIEWKCRVTQKKSDSAILGWQCMHDFADTDAYRNNRVSRAEYYEHGAEWCTKHRFGFQNWM